jgi:hypothetical protein
MILARRSILEFPDWRENEIGFDKLKHDQKLIKSNIFQESAMIRRIVQVVGLIALITTVVYPGFSQTTSDLQNYLSQTLKLSQDQIASIRSGQPYATNLTSRTPAEIFVFGAVYINAYPESYVKFANDYNRLRSVPGYLAIQRFSTPPQLSDLKGFGFGSDDVQALKRCKPDNCAIQLPGSTIEQLRQSINWSGSDVDDQVNQFIQKLALSRLQLYQKEGSGTLGAVYNDKKQQVNVADQFQFILSSAYSLQKYLPDFYSYLTNYPNSKPANVESTFYWDSVKFGLKPTLRIVQVFILTGNTAQQAAYVIAEKQLYSSHYFETALDLTFCISGMGNPQQKGFYLVQVMGSEQAGLTGFEGSIIRHVAVDRSVSDLQKSLATIKSTLEEQ